jgi:hypothetical protein
MKRKKARKGETPPTHTHIRSKERSVVCYTEKGKEIPHRPSKCMLAGRQIVTTSQASSPLLSL